MSGELNFLLFICYLFQKSYVALISDQNSNYSDLFHYSLQFLSDASDSADGGAKVSQSRLVHY